MTHFLSTASACLLLLALSFAVSAQPTIEARGSEEDASADADEIAADELVQQLRESRREAPAPGATIQERFANSSIFYEALLLQCEPSQGIRIQIQAAESRLEQSLAEDPASNPIVDGLRSRIMDLRSEAYRDCCDRSELVCFE